LRDASDDIHLCIHRTSHILPLWENYEAEKFN
jgi:hypothetical protein